MLVIGTHYYQFFKENVEFKDKNHLDKFYVKAKISSKRVNK